MRELVLPEFIEVNGQQVKITDATLAQFKSARVQNVVENAMLDAAIKRARNFDIHPDLPLVAQLQPRPSAKKLKASIERDNRRGRALLGNALKASLKR